MFEEKENEINSLNAEIEQMRSNTELNSEEMVIKLNALNEQILKKERAISTLENEIQDHSQVVKAKNKEIETLQESLQSKTSLTSSQIQKLREDKEELEVELKKLSKTSE